MNTGAAMRRNAVPVCRNRMRLRTVKVCNRMCGRRTCRVHRSSSVVQLYGLFKLNVLTLFMWLGMRQQNVDTVSGVSRYLQQQG